MDMQSRRSQRGLSAARAGQHPPAPNSLPTTTCTLPAPTSTHVSLLHLPPPAFRFGQYPQELTLALDAPARLAQIQLLSHEFKIAAKVELLVAGPEGLGNGNAGTAGSGGGLEAGKGGGGAPAWRRLGFLSFDSNERSSFTARELKSVALNGTPASLLRLVFHRCHANAANIYGQVR
jgi:hypothetical protein